MEGSQIDFATGNVLQVAKNLPRKNYMSNVNLSQTSRLNLDKLCIGRNDEGAPKPQEKKLAYKPIVRGNENL